MTVSDVASELRTIAASFSEELLVAPGGAAAGRSAAGGWSPKEVLGHLIDSAVNNHQRFVRAEQADALTFPGYEQNHWVSSQGYRDADWAHLVALWTHLNLHLADVIARIPPSKYSVPCTIGDDAAVPLEALVVGYRNHLHHHMAQIRERLSS
jgi:hypothetical protein